MVVTVLLIKNIVIIVTRDYHWCLRYDVEMVSKHLFEHHLTVGMEHTTAMHVTARLMINLANSLHIFYYSSHTQSITE